MYADKRTKTSCTSYILIYKNNNFKIKANKGPLIDLSKPLRIFFI